MQSAEVCGHGGDSRGKSIEIRSCFGRGNGRDCSRHLTHLAQISLTSRWREVRPRLAVARMLLADFSRSKGWLAPSTLSVPPLQTVDEMAGVMTAQFFQPALLWRASRPRRAKANSSLPLRPCRVSSHLSRLCVPEGALGTLKLPRIYLH